LRYNSKKNENGGIIMKSSTIKTIGLIAFISGAVIFWPVCIFGKIAIGFACFLGGVATYINLLIMGTVVEHLENLNQSIRRQMMPPLKPAQPPQPQQHPQFPQPPQPQEKPFLKD
jgi:hypothetical protein